MPGRLYYNNPACGVYDITDTNDGLGRGAFCGADNRNRISRSVYYFYFDLFGIGQFIHDEFRCADYVPADNERQSGMAGIPGYPFDKQGPVPVVFTVSNSDWNCNYDDCFYGHVLYMLLSGLYFGDSCCRHCGSITLACL
jgi:hypothetical protein